MAEFEPVLSDEVASMAWEAAQRTNVAFDDRAAVNRLANDVKVVEDTAEFLVGLVDTIVKDEAYKLIERTKADAEMEFQHFYDMAAVVMAPGGKPENSLWGRAQAIETEPVEVPEIDAETFQKLETLSPEFFAQVTTRYADAYRSTEGYIREGKLPESFRMPELKGLMDRIEAVAPAFEALKDKSWSPSIEFVPEGLTSAEWNDLFAGHKLPNGEQMVGNYRTISENTIDTVDRDFEQQGHWDVAVISASDRPTYTQVSKDGRHGSNAKEAVKAFAALPWVASVASTPADVIARVSPREEVYNRMQLARLERGEQPVDNETWTISQANVEVGGRVGSVVQGFYPDYRRVGSGWYDLDDPNGSGGVRPSASGSDLVFKAVTSS